MQFGSVEFFKVLIKTVLVILFCVPLVLAVVFGVLFAQKNTEAGELQQTNSKIQQENNRLSVIADVLSGEKAGTAQDIRQIMELGGVSYEQLIALALEKKDITADGLYKIMADSGMSDKDIVAMAAAKKTLGADDFYSVMSKNGISAGDLIKSAAKNSVMSNEELYDILVACGMSDSEIIDIINRKNGAESNASSSSDSSDTSAAESEETSESEEPSPYAELYTDMYVDAPDNYVYEDGTIYFTFDDGPSTNTVNILYYLKQFNVKATWFVVPSREQWCMDALKAISDAGNVIGVHSLTHDYDKIYASVEAFLDDFHEAWSIIKDATGQAPQIFRFPGGSKNDFNEETRDAIIKEMTRRGFRYYDWNVESGDANEATWQDMYNSIPRDCHAVDRPVILMHDSAYRNNTVYVLEDVLRVLKGEGYKFDVIHNDTEPVQFIGPFS